MISDAQSLEIRRFLLDKNLPIDILLEVQDHFTNQVQDIMCNEKVSFESAFEKVKEIWKPDLKTKVPFYILKNRKQSGITMMELRIRKDSDIKLISYSVIAFIGAYLFLLLSTKLLAVQYYKFVAFGILFISLLFCVLTLFYNLIINRFAYSKKGIGMRFSIYHWGNNIVVSVSYFAISYITPLSDWLPLFLENHFSWEVLSKFIVFGLIVVSSMYSGLAQCKAAKSLRMLKKSFLGF